MRENHTVWLKREDILWGNCDVDSRDLKRHLHESVHSESKTACISKENRELIHLFNLNFQFCIALCTLIQRSFMLESWQFLLQHTFFSSLENLLPNQDRVLQSTAPKSRENTASLSPSRGLLQRTGSQLSPVPCACAKATTKERGTYPAMHKYYRYNSSANMQNCDVQIRQRRGSTVLVSNHPRSTTIVLAPFLFRRIKYFRAGRFWKSSIHSLVSTCRILICTN